MPMKRGLVDDLEDLEGRPIVDFIGREALETVLPHIRKALQGQRVEYETVVKYLDTGPRRVQFTYVPDRDAHRNCSRLDRIDQRRNRAT